MHRFLGTGEQEPATAPASRNPERRLATILFTDIVGSTELAARHGDRRWLEILGQHNAIVREGVREYAGREVKTTGDGFVILFDGPAQAIFCSWEIIPRLEKLGIQVRCAVHIGEIEIADREIGGIGVHIAARILDHAAPGSIIATGTVKDAAVGTAIDFKEGGAHSLKGVPGEWRLYFASAPSDR